MMNTSTTMAEKAFSREVTSLNLLESTTHQVMPNAVGANSLKVKALWISRDTWKELKVLQLQDKFKDAMQKGFAPTRSKSTGIIRLTKGEVVERSGYIYDYKIKILSKIGSHYRLFGRIDDNGALIFDYLKNTKK